MKDANVPTFEQPFMSPKIPRSPSRRLIAIVGLVLFFLWFLNRDFGAPRLEYKFTAQPARPERHPVKETIPLPRQRSAKIPKIQHAFAPETIEAKRVRLGRLDEVREAFLHAWAGYKKEAWAEDELKPISGGFKTPFCGWAATMVDSLDTLLIMGLEKEFQFALAVLPKIDFTNTVGCQINLFETTIRHLGGLLSAWDLSGSRYPILMEKAVELGEVLYSAFDTPNRMPAPHYTWSANDPEAFSHQPSKSVVLAVLGSLSLEFTRLAQITGNDKYFDAIQRVMDEMEKWQPTTSLPGMWPAMVDSTLVNQRVALKSPYEESALYTLGALADSAYEYLPKQYMMLGGQMKMYKTMYESFIEVAKKHLFFRPMTVGDEDILISGSVNVLDGGPPTLTPELQHLTCFTGGMLAIAGKIFNRPEDVADGGRLTDGCVWAYRNTVTGIMPETLLAVPCADKTSCHWNTKKWWDAMDPNSNEDTIREITEKQKLSPGFVRIIDGRYLLRPEAIESVFIMHRVTGNPYWAESGWKMFKSIESHCRTEIAHSAIENVLWSVPHHVDEMESFWLAETLKYFYLLYSEPGVVSLDEFVLNTEAHPLRRPV